MDNANESGGSCLASRVPGEGSAPGARDLGNGYALLLERIAIDERCLDLFSVGPFLMERMEIHQHACNMSHLMVISPKDR